MSSSSSQDRGQDGISAAIRALTRQDTSGTRTNIKISGPGGKAKVWLRGSDLEVRLPQPLFSMRDSGTSTGSKLATDMKIGRHKDTILYQESINSAKSLRWTSLTLLEVTTSQGDSVYIDFASKWGAKPFREAMGSAKPSDAKSTSDSAAVLALPPSGSGIPPPPPMAQ